MCGVSEACIIGVSSMGSAHDSFSVSAVPTLTFGSDGRRFCRTEWGVRLPYNDYVLDTCAKCYNYMPDTAFKDDIFGVMSFPEFLSGPYMRIDSVRIEY
ncbi:unnamed protein product [Oppiella nova]|uniref:Uncharacterized protein n=1 Tax=Oppiella nova TaxID=334625 RepID=A0A7R9LW13_9ACAR|nr:unnamed protein product [Oppiella nova]CAG2167535.1 unnamed protein product [Oppiella nova]